jgi:type VI secretion system protein VasG
VLPRVSIEYLTRMSQGVELNAISLGAADGEFTYVFD